MANPWSPGAPRKFFYSGLFCFASTCLQTQSWSGPPKVVSSHLFVENLIDITFHFDWKNVSRIHLKQAFGLISHLQWGWELSGGQIINIFNSQDILLIIWIIIYLKSSSRITSPFFGMTYIQPEPLMISWFCHAYKGALGMYVEEMSMSWALNKIGSQEQQIWNTGSPNTSSRQRKVHPCHSNIRQCHHTNQPTKIN